MVTNHPIHLFLFLKLVEKILKIIFLLINDWLNFEVEYGIHTRYLLFKKHLIKKNVRLYHASTIFNSIFSVCSTTWHHLNLDMEASDEGNSRIHERIEYDILMWCFHLHNNSLLVEVLHYMVITKIFPEDSLFNDYNIYIYIYIGLLVWNRLVMDCKTTITLDLLLYQPAFLYIVYYIWKYFERKHLL